MCAQTRAPSREALRQLTPERILDALEAQSGAMNVQGLARTPAERRAYMDAAQEQGYTEQMPQNRQMRRKLERMQREGRRDR